jgi:hypothetical protein
MRFAEFQSDAVSDLVILLRNQLKTADNQEKSLNLTWEEVSALMSDMNHGDYNYATFKPMYDANPQLQAIVGNFNNDGITLDTSVEAEPETVDIDQDTEANVDKMAKRAASKRI